ncbi:MAG: helix-hairpin-helix domain-containing protein [Thermodesulfobacteriota bacterium]|nr:helix-hairpin-helix domain-containing protein [Thermodesulfobacteriota bacterium]
MNITRGQICGAITIVLIATSFYFSRFFLHYFRPLHTISIPYIEKKTGSVIVELTGDTDHKGIYFVPPNTTVSNLFRIAKVADTRKFNRKDFSVILGSGEKVIIDSDQVKIGKIDAAKRITLDIPIDINNATAYDLSLIPGIGKKTAQAIVGLRRSTGGISSINDLLKIHGIGKKKFTKIKKYLAVNGKT